MKEWVWSVGGMTMTRENWSTGRQDCHSANLFTTTHNDWHGSDLGPQWWQAGDCPSHASVQEQSCKYCNGHVGSKKLKFSWVSGQLQQNPRYLALYIQENSINQKLRSPLSFTVPLTSGSTVNRMNKRVTYWCTVGCSDYMGMYNDDNRTENVAGRKEQHIKWWTALVGVSMRLLHTLRHK